MYGITVTLVGNKEGVYIDCATNNAYVDQREAVNYNDINMRGVHHLVIDREEDGTMKIIQASGYTRERGMFCDLY